MWQAVQISIAGICGVMVAILLLYFTVRVSGYITGKIEKKGDKTDE
ncbi:MAG: hypothetical protein K9K82_03270 [Desulfobacteraceae bacterium]|nr:hypothetical protein [Desulfobacteraceae bacterium]